MVVEIKLVPDGTAQIPVELTDSGIVATYLSNISVPDHAPIDSWRAIERVTRGDKSQMTLRIRGIMLDDVPDKLLTQAHEALTTQVAGVKPHPNGWVEYDETDT